MEDIDSIAQNNDVQNNPVPNPVKKEVPWLQDKTHYKNTDKQIHRHKDKNTDIQIHSYTDKNDRSNLKFVINCVFVIIAAFSMLGLLIYSVQQDRKEVCSIFCSNELQHLQGVPKKV